MGSEAEPSTSLEVELVCRARDGQTDAFAELVTRYQRRAVSVAYRLLGNIEDASDVSQDAFLRAYRGLGQLEDPSRFGPWLMRVVSNLALNFRRRRKLRYTVPLHGDDAGLSEGHDPPDTRTPAPAEAGSLPDELQVAVSQAMAQLPEKQRLALVLFSVEGMPQKDVAEILDCSIELVKWNVFQARRKLKDMLQPYL